MRKHTEVGYRIAQATSELIPIANYILCHHERWDGKGYPQGLIGENIPLLSRIVAIGYIQTMIKLEVKWWFLQKDLA